MRHSDINTDLLPLSLNAIKPPFYYFSLILAHSSPLSLPLSHATNTALHSAEAQKLQHKPQAKLCHTQVYSLGFIIHLPIRQPSETMTPQTPI